MKEREKGRREKSGGKRGDGGEKGAARREGGEVGKRL